MIEESIRSDFRFLPRCLWLFGADCSFYRWACDGCWRCHAAPENVLGKGYCIVFIDVVPGLIWFQRFQFSPSWPWYLQVQPILKKYDILLIADEVLDLLLSLDYSSRFFFLIFVGWLDSGGMWIWSIGDHVRVRLLWHQARPCYRRQGKDAGYGACALIL